MAERLGVPVATVHSLEAGSASIDIETLYRTLQVLGLKKNFYTLAADRPMQRKLRLIQSIADAKTLRKNQGELT